jgi:hypothetical protein
MGQLVLEGKDFYCYTVVGDDEMNNAFEAMCADYLG